MNWDPYDFQKRVQKSRPAAISSFRFPHSLRLLYIAPHPDDFDAVAITMRWFLQQGNPVYLAVVSPSASGVEDTYCAASPTSEAKASIRESEQRASCRVFGLHDDHLAFLHFHDDESGQPAEDDANLQRLRNHLSIIRPHLVVLPHGNDSNVGHQRVHRMVKRTLPNITSPAVLLLNRDPKTVAIRSDLYMAFNDADAVWKAELLRCHDSQHQRNLHTRGHGFDERILGPNRDFARELNIGAPYAEAFELEVLN